MDRHMKVDQILISKIQKLAEIREKCTLTRKQETMQNLKVKVRQLNERRQRNALKCLQVVTKYEKLLGIRVKDTVFRFWDRLRKEGISVNSHLVSADCDHSAGGLFSPTFNGGQSVMLHENSYSMSSISNLHNSSSFLEESSVTSALYLKAKSVYKMRALFNKLKLKRHFDSLLIKCFSQNYRNHLYNLEGRALVKLHSVLSQ